ncbi:MAG: alpha/beta fold hydrolase [Gemmatimonadales bacterium]|nr:alpha/beta fold hydrolase [Gemmatimonadales bacterium]NIN10632.1 alpha/beta fold hydrolase [Gemmatimonadales bacterium]NIN49394.1 alpha/beta fold hydrolase [Gemmatimonadales bacterium]NIP06858.1 alpha/beta fold hydrolase [Gemmatimonadales bacterium]NIR01532.1 alpha/beta fold hydrolase [Gemmatimonadales bacterium]
MISDPDDLTATEAAVTVNGVSLHVRFVGEGPDVVVLHGGPGAHHDYLLPQFDALANGRCLRYYDQRGGGRSPVARGVPVGWREHVADLNALVDLWGLAPVTLLGYSWGGLLALLYAATYPDRVGRLALVSPAPLTPEHRAEFERRITERLAHPRVVEAREALRRSNLRHQDSGAYRQRAFELSVAGYFRNPDRARDLTPFRVTGRTQRAVWESIGASDLREELAQLEELCIPALVIHGRHDPIPLATAQHVSQLLGARLDVFENSGHVPHVEEHEDFVEILDEFLPKRQ